MSRRIVATAAVALIVPTACVAWGLADWILPRAIRALDAAWDRRAMPF